MKCLCFTILMGVLSLATGCCSTCQQWGQLEGYQDITFVYNGQPLSLSSKAPRDDIYGLWQLSGKRSEGKCVYREGSDSLILTVFLHKGEMLGFCKSKDGLNAYAGNLCVPLPYPDYSWRLEMTKEDKKQNAQENFWYGVTDVGYGFRLGIEYVVTGLTLAFAGGGR